MDPRLESELVDTIKLIEEHLEDIAIALDRLARQNPAAQNPDAQMPGQPKMKRPRRKP